MFGMGMPEMMVILVVALIVIGPSRLPEIARSLGKGYAEFARSIRDVKRGFEDITEEFEQEANVFHNPADALGQAVEKKFGSEENEPESSTAIRKDTVPTEPTEPTDPSRENS